MTIAKIIIALSFAGALIWCGYVLIRAIGIILLQEEQDQIKRKEWHREPS